MPNSTGDPNAFLAVGMQSGLGSPQTTATKFRFIKTLASDLDPDMQVTDLRELGDGLNWGFTYKNKQAFRGQIVFNARPEALGQLLAAVPAGATWNGASGPAAITYHTSHASHPWMTIMMQHPASQIMQMISDARFTGITIDGQPGMPWKVTMPFVAITHGASFAALTPTYYGDDPFLYHGQPSYVIDGTADSDITGFTLGVTLGVDELQSQSVLLDELPVMNRDVDLQITRRFESPSLWAKIYYGAAANITPTTSVATGSFQAGVGYGAAGVTQRLAQINLPVITYRGNKITGIDPDGKTVTETIAAKGVQGATSALYIVVNNAHASAYTS